MKRSFLPALTLFAALAANSAFAQTPRVISYQGVLSDTQGNVVTDGTRTLTINLYDVQTGGSPLYTETQTARFVRGVFNVTIGSVNPIPTSLGFDRQYYIGITVDNNGELAPRTPFTSSPYALHATTADHAKTADVANVANALAANATGVVTDLNGASGKLNLVGTGNTTVTRAGNTITINTTSQSAPGVQSVTNYDGSILVFGSATANPQVAVATNGITTSRIADSAVTDAKIAYGINYAKLFGAPATLPPSGAAGGDLSGTYPNPVIAASAINTGKIADGAVTDAKVANGISYSKLSGAPTSLPPTGPALGDLSGTYPAPVVAANAITTSKIADNAITNSKIVDNAITTSKIADNAITTSKIVDNAVTTAKIADGSVINSKIADNAITTSKIVDNAVTTAKIADGAVTDAKVANGISYSKLSGAPTSLPPSGPAGGDLGGTYPNPTVVADAINSAKIADGSIIGADVAPNAGIGYSKLVLTNSVVSTDLAGNAVTTPKITDGAVTTPKLADSAVSGLKILTNAVNTAHIADGAVTMAKLGPDVSFSPTGAAGGDLSGTYPNPTVANSAITSAKIADSTISSADIAANAAIPYSKLTLTNSIQNSDIVANAITTSKVANGTVTTSKLADSAVSGLKLLTYAVTDRHIADGAVTLPKLNPSGAASGQVIGYDGANIVWTTPQTGATGAAGGDLTGTYPNPTIANDAITSVKIADGAVNNQDLAPNSVTTSKVANGTVTTSKMADSAVSGLKLLTYAVTNRHLAANAVTTDKIDPTGATNGQVIGYNGTNVVWTTPAAAGAVTTNATLTGNGQAGTPLGINLGNSNTWTANQTFGGTFLITANSRIAMTNSDNNARDIRFQEPSGTGSQYIGLRAPSVSNNGNYVFPAVVGNVGDVLTLGTSNGIDSATMQWSAPGGGATGAAGGDLTGTYPNPTIANDAITSAKILDGSVGSADITDGGVNNQDLAANSVTTSKVANGTVTTSKLADSAVSGLKLLTFAVTNRHLADGSVSGTKLGYPFAANNNTAGAMFSITNNGNGSALYVQGATGQTGLELNRGRMIVSYNDGVVAPNGTGGTVAIPDGSVMVVIRAGATTGGFNITLPAGTTNGQVLNVYNSDANNATVTSGNVLNASNVINTGKVMQYTWVTTNVTSGWVGQ